MDLAHSLQDVGSSLDECLLREDDPLVVDPLKACASCELPMMPIIEPAMNENDEGSGKRRKFLWPEKHAAFVEEHCSDHHWTDNPLPSAATFDRHPGLRALTYRQFELLFYRVKATFPEAELEQTSRGTLEQGKAGRGSATSKNMIIVDIPKCLTLLLPGPPSQPPPVGLPQEPRVADVTNEIWRVGPGSNGCTLVVNTQLYLTHKCRLALPIEMIMLNGSFEINYLIFVDVRPRGRGKIHGAS